MGGLQGNISLQYDYYKEENIVMFLDESGRFPIPGRPGYQIINPSLVNLRFLNGLFSTIRIVEYSGSQ